MIERKPDVAEGINVSVAPSTTHKNMSQRKSPGLVVVGNDSCSRVREIKSITRYRMDTFSHRFVVKMVLFVGLKRPKIKQKEVHFKK